jgi:hypothetical protein
MHDFIQAQSFSATRNPFAVRAAVPEWVQRGLMRSFGDDDLPAYHPSPRPSGRQQKRRSRPIVNHKS